jgi:hypothetical protein
MRSHRFAPLGLFLLATACSAVAYAQLGAPNKAELEMTSDPKAPGAAAVYLDRVETTDDPHHFSSIYARIKVLTEEGKKAATVHVSSPANFVYHASGDNSSRMSDGGANHLDAPNVNHSGEDMPNVIDHWNVKLEIAGLQGRTIQLDGTIVPMPANALQVEHRKNGQDEYSFTLPNVGVGSVLEYRYQIRYDRFEGAPDWQVQKDYFTHHAHFSFTPDERFLQARNKTGQAGIQDSSLVDSHFESMTDIRSGVILPESAKVITEAFGSYSLDMNDIPAFPAEPFATPAEGQAYRVSFYYLAAPDEKDFWQKEMSFWIRGVDKYTASTAVLQSVVKELTTGAANQTDKAKKLYEYVQKIENTDFALDGQPRARTDSVPGGRVDKLITEKKGESNQIAYLYLGLARAAGLNAQPERIASRSHRIFSPHFRQTNQLDTVVIALNLDGTDVTVDPGTPKAPFGTLHWAHSATTGLAMIGGKVDTVFTTPQKGTDNAVLHVGSLSVDSQGAVSGTVKVAYIGQEALRLRQIALRSGNDALAAELNRNLSAQIPEGITIKLDHIAYVDNPGKQLLAVVNVSGALKQDGGRFEIPRGFFQARERNPFPEESERKLAVDVRFPEVIQEKIAYVLPAGFGLIGKPDDAKLNWEALGYSSTITPDKNGVTVSRVFARGFTLLEAEKYTPLHDFYDRVAEADQKPLKVSAGVQASNAQ